MCGIVGRTILRQEEGSDSGAGGVRDSRDVVFEEVEEGERGEEEGGAPERVLEDEKEEDSEAEGEAEGSAEEEGAEGDPREGLGLAGEVGWVEGRGRGRGERVGRAVALVVVGG